MRTSGKRRAAAVISTSVAIVASASWMSGAAATPQRGGELDAETFEACGDARENDDAATAKDAKRATKEFKALNGKQANAISETLSESCTKKERRSAFNKAVMWCRSQDAYRMTPLTLPPGFEVADATTAAVSGVTRPGATVTVGATAVTADGAGNFSAEVSGLVAGDNSIAVTAEAALHYPSNRSITIVQTESEAAFKASTGEIPYDELVKDPDALFGRRIFSRAQVFQFDSRTGDGLLVSVTLEQPGQFEFWTDNVFLSLLENPGLGGGIDNGDIVEFWGTVAGALEYDTAIGGTNSVPSVLVTYMTLIEKRDE